jgi:hypothetical protein
MTYGYEAQGRNDKKIDAARRMADFGTSITLPGALLVNDLPFRERSLLSVSSEATLSTSCSVRHIPDWVPWFSYKPLARVGHDLGVEVLNGPMGFVKEAMVGL